MISAQSEKALIRLFETGVSESAERLATLLHTNWQTQEVSLRPVPTDKFTDNSGGDQEHYGSFFTMPGAVFGVMFSRESAPRLAKAFFPSGPAQPDVTERWVRDTIAEMSNVIVHAVANTLADATGDVFFLSAPQTVVGRRQDLIRAAPSRSAKSEKAFFLMAYVHMLAEELSADCSLLLLLGSERCERLLKALED